jgi:hypothetical protein
MMIAITNIFEYYLPKFEGDGRHELGQTGGRGCPNRRLRLHIDAQKQRITISNNKILREGNEELHTTHETKPILRPLTSHEMGRLLESTHLFILPCT